MTITFMQGILLALVAFICAVDKCWEAFYWFRPMVVAFFAGIALGDISLGVKCGAVAELSYLGLLTVGGTVPPDALIAEQIPRAMCVVIYLLVLKKTPPIL